jgi:hypothetical protein
MGNEANVMHDDDSRFQRFAPLLRRVIILLAVLAATPVVLWMITAFVRAYVGPPKVPSFHQLASTTPMAAPETAAASTANSDQPAAAPMQAKVADITASTTETRTTASDARDVPSPKGSLLSDRPPDGAASAPATVATTAPAATALAPSQTPAAPAAPAAPMNVATTEMPASSNPAPVPQQPVANATTAEVPQPPAAEPAATEQPADALPASPPLTGKIPLPRRRPRGLGEANTTRVAQGAVPMPRPRPDSAGPAAPSETASTPGPLEFIQNIFH